MRHAPSDDHSAGPGSEAAGRHVVRHHPEEVLATFFGGIVPAVPVLACMPLAREGYASAARAPGQGQGGGTLTAAARAAEPGVADAYLVDRAREGYLDAYELLVQRHSAMAYRVALRLTGNHHDAQDVAQEALIAAWENLVRFRAGSSFSTWLYQIVTRRTLNKVQPGPGRQLPGPPPRGRRPGRRARGPDRTQPRGQRSHRRAARAAVPAAGGHRPSPFRGTVLR